MSNKKYAPFPFFHASHNASRFYFIGGGAGGGKWVVFPTAALPVVQTREKPEEIYNGN